MARKRQSVTFSEEAVELLNDLADEQGVSISEVVRRALTRESWFTNAIKHGKILYQPDGAAQPHQVEFIG